MARDIDYPGDDPSGYKEPEDVDEDEEQAVIEPSIMASEPHIMRRPIPYYECAYNIAVGKKYYKCSHPERSTTSISEDMADCKNPCPIGCLIPRTVDEKFMDGA